jgi:hypothetical protein
MTRPLNGLMAPDYARPALAARHRHNWPGKGSLVESAASNERVTYFHQAVRLFDVDDTSDPWWQ